MKWSHTVNDIIINNRNTISKLNINSYQLRIFNNIAKCHTAELGGVALACSDCNHVQYKYHSCRNRHCPSCQGGKTEEWINRQQKYLLNVPYFHVVFTIPEELRSLCIFKPRIMYNLLFKASWETIHTLSKDSKHLGAHSGMTAVLHTWSQNLGIHPHLHCIIPGGGVTKNGKWISTKSKGNYLFPKDIMRPIFKAIFMKELKILVKAGDIPMDRTLREKLYSKKWVVFAKRPFAKPANVIEYLGRYTHKVAISNYRIINVSDTHVTFKWKDYRHGAKVKKMELPVKEFLRRFAMHILPHRFVRIRHFGILSFHGRSKIIPELQKSLGHTPIIEVILERPTTPSEKCTACNSTMLIAKILPKKAKRDP